MGVVPDAQPCSPDAGAAHRRRAQAGARRGAPAVFASRELDDGMLETIRAGERTGRPMGDADFVERLEAETGREQARRKPGPKPAAPAEPFKQGRLILECTP